MGDFGFSPWQAKRRTFWMKTILLSGDDDEDMIDVLTKFVERDFFFDDFKSSTFLKKNYQSLRGVMMLFLISKKINPLNFSCFVLLKFSYSYMK